MRTRIILAFMTVLALAACANRDIRMRDLRGGGSDDGPEEFAIEPVKPLQEPGSYSALPAPTPGGRNLADATPKEDSVRLLGGNPARLSEVGAPPASDGALVRHTRRFGVPGGIRQSLAEEDEKFRRRMSRFTRIRIAKVDRYNQAYRRQTLDPAVESLRWKKRGLSGPSAPPRQ